MIVRDNNKLLSSHNNLSPYVQSVGPVSCVGSRPPIGGTHAVAPDLRPFTAFLRSPLTPTRGYRVGSTGGYRGRYLIRWTRPPPIG